MKKEKSIDLSNKPKEKKLKKAKEKVVKSADRDPSVTLNVQQEEAIVKLKEFLKNDEKEFTIMGAGGTGKTFLIQELFKRKKQNSNEFYVPSTVIGVCVTHMARLNLMKSIPNTTTYASATNLVMAFDPMGNMYFMQKYTNHNFSELKMYKYIVVDECSMFDHEMKANLIKCCSPTAKIIWMGDSAQLPPIQAKGDHDSPTFDVLNKYELTIKMRQDNDDHIAILGDEVRKRIFGEHDLSFLNDITQQWDPEKGKGYSITTLDKVIPSYVKNFKAGMDVRITSYRNSRIKQLNAMVRRVLWEDKASEQFVPGEFIVMDDQYSPNREVLAYCGQTFKVIKIYVEVIDFVECHMIVVPRWNGINGANETVTLAVPTDKGIVFYKRHLEHLKALAINTKDWSEYKAFKDQFSNVSYAYAMNNYKIQGSTIKGCYVDLSDILDVKPISAKRKLQAFYVGISRPADFCAIF